MTPRGATRAGSKESLWKSVIGATGAAYGCERETFYREVTRDARGYRVRFPAGESIIFGLAVDVAHGYLMERRLEHGPADSSLIGFDLTGEGVPLTDDLLYQDAANAVRRGVSKARGRGTSEPWTEEEWKALASRTGLAVEKALGLWPNRVKESKGRGSGEVTYLPQPEPDGTPPGPPIAWLDRQGTTTHLQEKLHAPDVVGGRGLTGQPDFIFRREGVIVGWLDVKALSKAGSYPAKWAAGEAVAYDYMATVANGGIVPEWHAYLEYRRNAKPYWALVEAPVSPSVVPLAHAYFRRWERALDGNDPDGLSFNPRSCGKCQFREPMPDLAFAGCPIGAAAVDILPDDPEVPAEGTG